MPLASFSRPMLVKCGNCGVDLNRNTWTYREEMHRREQLSVLAGAEPSSVPSTEHSPFLFLKWSCIFLSFILLFLFILCLLYISLERVNRRIIIRRQMLITLNILQCSLYFLYFLFSALFSFFHSIGIYHFHIEIISKKEKSERETQLKPIVKKRSKWSKAEQRFLSSFLRFHWKMARFLITNLWTKA